MGARNTVKHAPDKDWVRPPKRGIDMGVIGWAMRKIVAQALIGIATQVAIGGLALGWANATAAHRRGKNRLRQGWPKVGERVTMRAPHPWAGHEAEVITVPEEKGRVRHMMVANNKLGTATAWDDEWEHDARTKNETVTR